ncbi:Uncharacterised protein [Mycobacteroides abscessus subsp. abscessus]|nr:Uncharacterised protein [Mycobacteroides abscessus subsp. abscessus]
MTPAISHTINTIIFVRIVTAFFFLISWHPELFVFYYNSQFQIECHMYW